MAPGSMTHSSLARGGDQASGSYLLLQPETFQPRQPWGSLEAREMDFAETSASFHLFLSLRLLFCKMDITVPVLFLQSQ